MKARIIKRSRLCLVFSCTSWSGRMLQPLPGLSMIHHLLAIAVKMLSMPFDKVIHPIHDQTFYLNMDHKRNLKEEYGIEPWTFTQKVGDAVFIPAGCPHQVRNLKSCTKVALDFVSPENVGECFRLTEEFRTLPINHRSSEDKLEEELILVKKMTIYAMKDAIKILMNARLVIANLRPFDNELDPLESSIGVKVREITPAGSKVPKIVLEFSNLPEEESERLKKLLNSIDKVEEQVLQQLQILENTASAKEAERENRVRTLMSMRTSMDEKLDRESYGFELALQRGFSELMHTLVKRSRLILQLKDLWHIGTAPLQMAPQPSKDNCDLVPNHTGFAVKYVTLRPIPQWLNCKHGWWLQKVVPGISSSGKIFRDAEVQLLEIPIYAAEVLGLSSHGNPSL
ncbi:unnamed protein product [Sphenostylis stenocarpa]|uniref:JmjC domain-containing protein n=1 Tax=Sphenostylis stenocarpa TaxID=92480 RepID=A0AA86VV32_9FABA|nr:unnamed protein product [Sphenostylis stenocarpa]